MSKYKDREGNSIKIGTPVLMAITMNQERFFFPYTIRICIKKGRSLILDDALGYVYLSDTNPEELQVLHKDVDLRRLMGEWGQKYKSTKNWSSHLTSSNAHDFAEEAFKLLGIDKYDMSATREAIAKIKGVNVKEDEKFSENMQSYLDAQAELRRSLEKVQKLGGNLIN